LTCDEYTKQLPAEPEAAFFVFSCTLMKERVRQRATLVRPGVLKNRQILLITGPVFVSTRNLKIL
jgi:hypothetical protein